MKRRDFLHSSLLAAATTAASLRAAYAVVATDTTIADLAAVSGDGRAITLRGADIRELARQMQGTLLIAGDQGYDIARQVMNPSIDRKPALIAQPRSVADVQPAKPARCARRSPETPRLGAGRNLVRPGGW
jgi:hypothetical protein